MAHPMAELKALLDSERRRSSIDWSDMPRRHELN